VAQTPTRRDCAAVLHALDEQLNQGRLQVTRVPDVPLAIDHSSAQAHSVHALKTCFRRDDRDPLGTVAVNAN
jgi:hypothetical protein